MNKSKIGSLAIACMIGLVGLNPITAFAAETNTESATLTEMNQNQKDTRAAFEEKMKKSNEKWNTLTSKQKDEVYALIEKDMETQNQLMDKLVEFGVIEKTDAELIKAHMLDRFNRLKESGEFPFARQKQRNSK